jgi:hypothetical protein
LKLVIEAVSELIYTQSLDTSRGQLDSQRHPVQASDDALHCRARLPVESEPAICTARPLSEQHDGI